MYANEQPRQSKRSMIAALPVQPDKAKLAARNTLDYTLPDGTRVIRLHTTDILTLHANGGFTINTGGWNTPTTRARLSEFLPTGYRVSTREAIAYLNAIPFRETVSVDAAGEIHSDLKPNDESKLTKQIDAYMKEWRKRGLPTEEDSKGDPWVFCTRESPKVSPDVMLDWVESKYVHRLLYGLALQYAGVPDTGIGYYHHWCDKRGGKLERIDTTRIRRYIRACLGLAA